ncbi:hypothetical protein EV702DRAFT_1048574 [Suillus placidus]|uniref:P-type ATPase C-terminal domain-containing protein n=1 Tax=Suillus placidus TaxID=48579 RepID=A0A9P7CZC4_9AGAM|nr:hypothetical protein EV702DRAFT_1048574 [Suillus placidus]
MFILISLGQVYSFFNNFSGQIAYESWAISFYNVIFTVLPPLDIGVFDQFVSILFTFTVILFWGDLKQATGLDSGHWFWGAMLYLAVLLTVLGKAALVSDLWTKYAVAGERKSSSMNKHPTNTFSSANSRVVALHEQISSSIVLGSLEGDENNGMDRVVGAGGVPRDCKGLHHCGKRLNAPRVGAAMRENGIGR